MNQTITRWNFVAEEGQQLTGTVEDVGVGAWLFREMSLNNVKQNFVVVVQVVDKQAQYFAQPILVADPSIRIDLINFFAHRAIVPQLQDMGILPKPAKPAQDTIEAPTEAGDFKGSEPQEELEEPPTKPVPAPASNESKGEK